MLIRKKMLIYDLDILIMKFVFMCVHPDRLGRTELLGIVLGKPLNTDVDFSDQK